MPFRPRPRRLDLPDVRVQFGHTVANLVDLSRTGASIRAHSTLRPGSEWPLALEISTPPVRLIGRVVRCVPVDLSLPGGAAFRGRYALAITFVNPSAEAQAVLEEVCGTEIETSKGTR
jgi:hypothetical protein